MFLCLTNPEMYSLRLITYYLNRIRYGGTTLVGSGGARLSGPKNMDFYQRSQNYFRKTSYTIGINRIFPNKAKWGTTFEELRDN